MVIRWTSMPGWWILRMNMVRPWCLGRLPVGAGQAHGVVGAERSCTPYLRTVEHEDVPVPGGPGHQAGQVGTAAGLGQELHPQLLAAEDGRDMSALLLLGAEVEQGGGQIDRVGTLNRVGIW